jgi:hypothetical protein
LRITEESSTISTRAGFIPVSPSYAHPRENRDPRHNGDSQFEQLDNAGEFDFQRLRPLGSVIIGHTGSAAIEQVFIFVLITKLDPGRLASDSHPVHPANKIRCVDDLHQNYVLPCFLRPVVVFEDVNEIGRKVPTEADAFADRTVVNSKLFLLRFN